LNSGSVEAGFSVLRRKGLSGEMTFRKNGKAQEQTLGYFDRKEILV
jgi:hypothetical protein